MSNTSPRRLRAVAPRGFTLVELMIVVAIAAILATVAYPSFMSQVRTARRAEAVDVVSRVQQAQERWRAGNAQYTSLASLGIPSTTSNGYYTIAASAGAGAAAVHSYTVTATAVGGKSQAGDSGCTVLTLSVSGGTPSYTPAACWKR
jgi:type IV pilus assembly protein PilE